MSNSPNALWLSVSPSWQRFHRPLLRLLSRHTQIAQWEYSQSQDEACSLAIALTLLHDYLKSRPRPVHLLGHSTGGLLGLLYARQHPQRVQSLTLLGVGVYPAVDWQAHYYVLRQLLPCNHQIILSQMVRTIFGDSHRWQAKKLVQLLEQDLQTSPSPHSLFQRGRISPGGVEMPLLVCGSDDDTIADPNVMQGWQPFLKPSDRLWQCPDGHHFFHAVHPDLVSKAIVSFWQSLPCEAKEIYASQ